jgi:large subunit ribosomal protein L7Ae
VRWPRYVKLQRQKRVLMQRLKVPVAINQFNYAVDKTIAARAFQLCDKYRPETPKDRQTRLRNAAEKKAAGKKVEATRPPFTSKFGLNHITALVEQRKAQLVLIAHDVDPIEV